MASCHEPRTPLFETLCSSSQNFYYLDGRKQLLQRTTHNLIISPVLVDSGTPKTVKRNRVERVEGKLLKTKSAKRMAEQSHPRRNSIR
ncbi:hypothetical protein SBV1_1450040 [Verrucomicrobia bacterium]|nr:hypothetical protein SBV1_1450040 [Verrucomicrobiota bacterium]